jgi:hypothetical protein
MTHFYGYEGRCAFPTTLMPIYCSVSVTMLLPHWIRPEGYLVQSQTSAHLLSMECSGIPITMMITWKSARIEEAHHQEAME